MALTEKNQLLIAFKKLYGKSHTSAKFGIFNESIASSVQLGTSTLFGSSIPSTPSTSSYSITSASVERVTFNLVGIALSTYTNTLGSLAGTTIDDEGDTAVNGVHAYKLVLPSNYTSLSSNTKKGTGAFLNSATASDSNGALQLIPPSFGDLYSAEVSSSSGIIGGLDAEDYYLDYYSGILFVQDISRTPTSVTAYLYVGDYGVSSAGSASFATTASYALNAATASYVLNAVSASYSTNAATASFLSGFNQNNYVTTASFNQFTGSYNTGSFTGSFIGTASYALNATSASFATTASYAVSSSHAVTASYSNVSLSSSFATTASYAENALSSSYALNTATASYATNALSSSYATTASYSTTGSYSLNALTASWALGGSGSFTGSFSGSAAYLNDVHISDYLQLLPVGALNIPTNTTASYIYTSGSTNDMYFTQYQGPYTNTTRLRWLESALNTGLLNGGTLSTVNGTNKFNVASGAGIILNYNASTSSDPYPTIKYVQWTSSISQSLQFSGSAQITYVAIDSNGEISQTTTAPTALNFKDRIVLGRILHQSGSVTNGSISSPATAYAVNSNNADFIRTIGPLKVSGHLLEASGSTLSLKKTAGDSYVEGRNYVVNPNVPNYISAADDPAVTISKIYRERVSGSTPIIDTGIGNAGYTTVDPTLYNNNGTLTAVGDKNYSVQRVYWFPRSVNRALFVYYGNDSYGTVNEAIAAVSTENFIEGDNTRGAAILVAYLVLKGNASNLTNTGQALIIQAGVLRGSVAGGGATAGVGATNLASLTDVLIGTPTVGEALVWNGTKWVDGTPLNATSASYAVNAATASHITDGANTSIQNAYNRLRYQTVGYFDITGSAIIMLPSSSLGGNAFPTGSFNYVDVSVTVKQGGRWINDLLSMQMYTSSTNVYVELSAPALTNTDQYKLIAVNENPSDYVVI